MILKINTEDLEDAILAFKTLKPILQKQLLLANEDKKQGEIDARDVGKHFDIAINSMMTVYGLMKGMKNNE